MALIEGKTLAILLVGFTHYVDVGKGEDAAIYYETGSQVRMLLPGAPAMSGEWRIQGDGYYVKWKEGPEGKWQIASEPGRLTYLDPTGKPAGNVTRIVPGNAANIP